MALQPIGEQHQFLHSRNKPSLLSERRQRHRDAIHLRLIHLRLRRTGDVGPEVD